MGGFRGKDKRIDFIQEKISKNKLIERLRRKYPEVKVKPNWVFLPEIVIHEKFISVSLPKNNLYKRLRIKQD